MLVRLLGWRAAKCRWSGIIDAQQFVEDDVGLVFRHLLLVHELFEVINTGKCDAEPRLPALRQNMPGVDKIWENMPNARGAADVNALSRELAAGLLG